MSNIVTLRNGAQALVLPNGQYRFVSGASPAYLRSIRPVGPRGPNKRPSGKPVGDAYLLKKLKADKGYNARAIHSDMSRKTKRRSLNPDVPRDARIIRRAGSLNKWDVMGLDDGSQGKGRKSHQPLRMRVGQVRAYPKRRATPAQLRALALARAARRR